MRSLLSALLRTGNTSALHKGHPSAATTPLPARQQNAFAETLSRLLNDGNSVGSNHAAATTVPKSHSASSTGAVTQAIAAEIPSTSPSQTATALQQSAADSGQKKTTRSTARRKNESRRTARAIDRTRLDSQGQETSQEIRSSAARLDSGIVEGAVRTTQRVAAVTGSVRARHGRPVAQSSVGSSSTAQVNEQPAQPSRGIANPKVSAVSLAATQASTPPVKELRAPERGRKQSALDHSAASVVSSSKQEAPSVTALIPTAGVSRPLNLSTAADATTDITAPGELVTTTGDPAELPTEGAVLRNAAHLRVESPELGQIALHLRVRDGVAEVRFDGDKAPALRERAPELARALASEGLVLGKVDPSLPSTNAASTYGDSTGRAPSGWESGDRGNGRKERDQEEPETPMPREQRNERSKTSSVTNRVHVRA